MTAPHYMLACRKVESTPGLPVSEITATSPTDHYKHSRWWIAR